MNNDQLLNQSRAPDLLIITGNSQQQLSVSATHVSTGALSGGRYAFWCTVDCWLKIELASSIAVTPVTVNNGFYLLGSNNKDNFIVPDQYVIDVILLSGAATFSYHKVS